MDDCTDESLEAHLKAALDDSECFSLLLEEDESGTSVPDESEPGGFDEIDFGGGKRLQKSALFYDILINRTKGYRKLLKALYKSKRTKTVHLLLKRYMKDDIVYLLEKYNFPLSYDTIFATEVTFHGRLWKLGEIFTGIDENILYELLDPSKDLIHDTIPSPPFFYVPRLISNVLPTSDIDNRQLWTSEEEFIDTIGASNDILGVCISGEAGEGKSSLLENLARLVTRKYPDKMVAIVDLPLFLQSLNVPPAYFRMSLSLALNLIFERICNSLVSRAIMINAIKEKLVNFELFLDGLEEVPSARLEWTKSLLKTLVTETRGNLRVYVTSTPDMRKEVEGFDIIVCDIQPFTQENQVDFLVECWKPKLSNYQNPKLEEFASTSLEICKETLGHLALTPLQSYLIAEEYKKDIEQLLDPESTQNVPEIRVKSIFELYQRFINARLFRDTQNKTGKRSVLSKIKKLTKSPTNPSNDQLTIKKQHVWKALELNFPKIAEKYAEIEGLKKLKPSEPNYLLFGLLEIHKFGEYTVAKFLHRTIADFLLAELFLSVLNGTYSRNPEFERNVINLFFDTTLSEENSCLTNLNWFTPFPSKLPTSYFHTYDFKYPGIISFINLAIDNNPEMFSEDVSTKTFLRIIKPQQLFQILQCSLVKNYIPLLRFIKRAIMKGSKDELEKFRPHIIAEHCQAPFLEEEEMEPSSELLHLSFQHSPLMTKELFQLFQECFQYNSGDVTDLDAPVGIHLPFHQAVIKGDYEMVKYLAKKVPLEGRALLYYCVEGSYSEKSEMVKQKLEICKFLLSKNKYLILEKAWSRNGMECGGPLLVHGIHLELMKHLIDAGANVRATVGTKTVVHCAADYMSPKNFHELTRFLMEDETNRDVFKMNSALQYILNHGTHKLLQTLRLILTIPGVVTDDLDESGNNLILLAVQTNHDVTLIMEMVRLGGDPKWKNREGKSALHFAAKHGNVETVEYFLSLGLSLEDRDNDGETPIFAAYRHLNMIKYLVDHGAKTDVHSNFGYTIAHCVAKDMSEKEFQGLIKLLLEECDGLNLISKENCVGETPLHLWLRHFGKGVPVDALGLLLAISAINVDSVDHQGNSLILAAVAGRQPVVVLKELVKFGADHDLQNKEGQSVFHLAVLNEGLECVQYFLSLEMNVNLVDEEKLTPLDLAKKKLGSKRRLPSHSVKSLIEIVSLLEEANSKSLRTQKG